MIGVDTNVVVRYLVRDDEKQAALAKRFFDDCQRRDETCFVGVIVLCEVAWVLAASYGHSNDAIIQALRLIVSTSIFEIESRDLVRRALDDLAEQGGDFADHLIGAVASSEGCSTTVTFDSGLKRSAAFRRL